MSLLNQTKENRVLRKPRSSKEVIDFSRVGGLSHHLKTLREVIIFPLLHGNVFTHFKIKAPRGVLFYGPPGTGKTLVAGALVSELNKEGIGKVNFFQRKGADILDKWVGESEKNLRALFEKATKCRPSIIFFDELDGLAPIRSEKNDHIHSSVVATLLSLIDGLDSKPGVIVIGATNRIEAIDPALRRKGRFDKELYFPLPGTEARTEILQVHINNWKHKPSYNFLCELADMTPGFCGADLQALCSEAVLACLRRAYPNIDSRGFNTRIDADSLRVDECDFLEARINLVPSSIKQGLAMRNLSNIVKPLLVRQHERIIKYINLLWPHFLQEGYKFAFGEQRYAGRILLVGTNMQGLNTHLIPSVLKNLEHIPTFVYDTRLFNKVKHNFGNISVQFPAVIVLSRIDEWWDNIDECDQHNVVSTLEDIHAGLPILTIASCNVDVPVMLHNFFYNNSTILIRVDNPNDTEREEFLAPLFFDESNLSLFFVWDRLKKSGRKLIKYEADDSFTDGGRRKKKKDNIELEYERLGLDMSEILTRSETSPRCKRKREPSVHTIIKKMKTCEYRMNKSTSDTSIFNIDRKIKRENDRESLYTTTSCESLRNKQYFTRVLSDLLNKRNLANLSSNNVRFEKLLLDDKAKDDSINAFKMCSSSKKNTDDMYRERIYNLWKHASLVTSKNMAVAQLELLYDVISACIGIHQNSIDGLLENLENVLRKIENSYQIPVELP
ncbi:unnamed protein product [Psylliodes chrysocephalus]|uniref:AAA+ ATPase domain-containing protein n=1 Tax=Psylliodes chrysocephalus TaxID=3402493 RepID=A0A9P0CYB5_9CUCU|nr:unnamed protein product [Psylliodes chrysocephala]